MHWPPIVRCRLILVFLSVLSGLTVAARGEVRFQHHGIDREGLPGRSWSVTVVADLNNDRRPDIIVGRSRWGAGPDAIFWYRNEGRIDAWSKRIPLETGTNPDCGGTAFDVDRDGWTDLVTGAYWYRNPGSPGRDRPFRRFRYGLGAGAHDIESADLDGDDRPEVVMHLQHKKRGGVYVFQLAEDPTQQWQRVTVAKTGDSVHAAVSPNGIGDVSGDGHPDIVFLGRWFENVDGRATRWKEHANLDFVREGKWGPAVRCWVADIDRDGHKDIVQSGCDMPKARVAWFRNVRGDGSKWEKHLLPEDGVPGDYHSLAVADFDLDGDADVYADEMEHIHVPPDGQFGMHLWENRDGRGKRWKKHTLVSGLGGHQAQVADFDGDGDLDIVTRPYTAGENRLGGRVHVSVLENLAR